jgi:hypothetical protein
MLQHPLMPVHNPIVDELHNARIISVGKIANRTRWRYLLVLGVDSYCDITEL